MYRLPVYALYGVHRLVWWLAPDSYAAWRTGRWYVAAFIQFWPFRHIKTGA